MRPDALTPPKRDEVIPPSWQIAGFARQREPDFGAIWFKENVLGSNRRRHRTNVPRVKSDLRPLPPEWGDTRKADESEWGLHQI